MYDSISSRSEPQSCDLLLVVQPTLCVRSFYPGGRTLADVQQERCPKTKSNRQDKSTETSMAATDVPALVHRKGHGRRHSSRREFSTSGVDSNVAADAVDLRIWLVSAGLSLKRDDGVETKADRLDD